MPDQILTLRQAINSALRDEMERDERVILMGEDIGIAGNIFKVTDGLLEQFGPERVIETPISEAGFAGIAVGAAMTGMRPVVEVMFSDFLTLASDQIFNQAAKLRYMTGGQCEVPLVLRTAVGTGRRTAAQHSQSLQAWCCHMPGVKVVMPSTPADAKGLMLSAIRDNNPVIYLEPKMRYNDKGPVPNGDYTVPLGKAKIHRSGRDVTIICTSGTLQTALEAAEELAEEGIEAEIIDPRTISPLDDDLLVESAVKTGHILIVDEGYRSFGITAEIAARIQEKAFDYLDAPIMRLGGADVPVPFAPTLEDQTYPTAEKVIHLVKALMS